MISSNRVGWLNGNIRRHGERFALQIERVWLIEVVLASEFAAAVDIWL